MEKITGSVGRGGDNRATDVKLIQKLLNAQQIPGEITRLQEDGKVGEKTIARIEAFQKKILKMVNPDGRVDPNGKTFRKLVENQTRPGAKAANLYSFSTKGVNLLKSIEELATKPYDDQTGRDITAWVKGATIGYGHLISSAEWSKYKDGITEAQAQSLFQSDLSPFVNTVKTKVTAMITQNEFDAMVLLTFNIGQQAFADSSALKLINNPNAVTSYTSLEAAWKAWNKSQGVVNKGLTNRRQAEWNIYTKGIYQKW